MPVMRLLTQADLTVGLQGLGFSGRLNTAFIERAPLTVRNARGSAGEPPLGHFEAYPTPARPPGVVAGILSLCPSSPHTARGARAATRGRWQTSGATRPPTNPCHGSRQHQPTMDGMRGALLPLTKGFHLSAT